MLLVLISRSGCGLMTVWELVNCHGMIVEEEERKKAKERKGGGRKNTPVVYPKRPSHIDHRMERWVSVGDNIVGRCCCSFAFQIHVEHGVRIAAGLRMRLRSRRLTWGRPWLLVMRAGEE